MADERRDYHHHDRRPPCSGYGLTLRSSVRFGAILTFICACCPAVGHRQSARAEARGSQSVLLASDESQSYRQIGRADESGSTRQTDRPALPEHADEPARKEYFSLRASELYLESEAAYDRRRVGAPRGSRIGAHRNRDLRLDQAVSLRLDGHVLDPAFLTWQGGLRLGITYERFREEIGHWRRSESGSGLLLEHDVSVDLFRDRPLTIHAYSRQLRQRVPRRFLPSLLEERREAGFSAFYVDGPRTTEVALDWSDVDLSGNRRRVDDESLETLRFDIDHRWEISERQRLRLAYTHQREQSTYQGSRFRFDTRRDQLRVEHELAFGSEDRHRLDTILRFNDEHGDLARDEIEFTPRLTLQHSDAFRTVYRYSFYRVKQDAIDLKLHKADVQAIYRPDDQFRLTTNAFWLREAIEDDLETYEFGGGADVSYRHPTAYGELLANLAYSAQRSRSTGSAGERIVRGESHRLDPTQPTFLRELDIRISTVVAYSVDRTRIFLPNVDYILVQSGRRTVAYRLLSGRIVEGQPVLFDYSFRIPSGARIDTHRVDLLLEHPFPSGLTPYYGFEIRRQYASGSRGRPARADHTERHRLGVRYQQPRWSAAAEAEWLNDTNEPYDAYRVDARVALLRRPGQTLDAHARASWFDFDGRLGSRRVWWVDSGLSGRFQHNPYLSTTMSTHYRWQEDSRSGTTNAVDLECGLHLRRGALEVDLTVEYDLLSLDQSDESLGVWLRIRRDLTPLVTQRHAAARW